MLVRDVRDDRHVEIDRVEPVLRESLRCRFDDRVRRARIDHLREQALNVWCVRRRRVQARVDFLIANRRADRRDCADLVPGGLQNRCG